MQNKNTPFIALIRNEETGDRYYNVFLVNPTNQNYIKTKKLTGAFAHGYDTGKAVFDLPPLNSNSYIKIDDIHWRERDFVIWYCLDLTSEDGAVKYFDGSIPKYIPENEKEFIEYIKKEGWRRELRDRVESIDELIKRINMEPTFVETEY